MHIKRSEDSWLRKLGFGGVTAGLLLAVTGLALNPASAAPGNNGTIKVDEQGLENGPGAPNSNDPHIDCAGRIEWYGFDEGAQTSDVIFEVQAPTSKTAGPGAEPSKTYSHVAVPDGNGAGGTTLDGTLDFDLSDLLADYQPHPKQGYHVKVTAHTTFSQGNDVKHKVFWIQPCETAPIGGLTIEKAVDGDDLPAAGTEFEFTLDCESGGQAIDLNGDDAGETATFVLTADGVEDFPLLPAGATCTITEIDDQSADSTRWVVDDGDPTPGDTDSVDVTIGDATTVAVVATNTYVATPPPPPPGPTFGAFSLNKDVTGDGAPDDDTEFTFDVECSNGLDQDVVLTADEAANVFGNLPTGTTCTIVETEDADATDTTWTGGTAIPGENGVSVTIGDGTTVAVTATNDFELEVQPTPPITPPAVAPPTVLPEVITPERPVAPEVNPTAGVQPTQVKGNVVTRPAQLPRTGSDALPLVEAGLGLVLLGLGAVLFGRERTAII